jgi:DNA-binding Lrp family transcriptional regulator
VPTIAKSIKELKKKRIILANRALLNFNKLDLHRYTIMIFANPKIEKQLIQYCKQNKKIWDIGKYAGTYNYVIEVFARDNDEFESVINSIKDFFKEDIFRAEVLIVFSELKHKYFYI